MKAMHTKSKDQRTADVHMVFKKATDYVHPDTGKNITVETYYCLWQTVGDNLVFEVEVTNPKDYQGDVGQEKRKVKTWVLNDGGRQENSLRTVRSILQVLYTNTGWSVYTCLGQVYILKQAAHTLGQVQIQVAGK